MSDKSELPPPTKDDTKNLKINLFDPLGFFHHILWNFFSIEADVSLALLQIPYANNFVVLNVQVKQHNDQRN
jgi:hypothetical protein